MLGIGIVDDNPEQRENIAEAFQLSADKKPPASGTGDWALIPSVPLKHLRDYPFWITENKIAALIVDERLKEVPFEGWRANYDGHDVVGYLRPRLQNLPMYIVTNYPGEEALVAARDSVTEIVGKDSLVRGESLASEILEKAEIYQKDFTGKLATIDSLAQKVAAGAANEEELHLLRGLQMELQLPFVDEKIENDAWIAKFEDAIGHLEALEKEASDFIKKIEGEKRTPSTE